MKHAAEEGGGGEDKEEDGGVGWGGADGSQTTKHLTFCPHYRNLGLAQLVERGPSERRASGNVEPGPKQDRVC